MRVNAEDEWNLSHLRVAKIAGAACPEAAAAEYERRYGCRVISSYGMTEAAATVTMADYDAPLHVRTAGVGKPIDGVSVKIDPESGELLIKSVSLMDGLLLEDGTIDPGVDEDGWFHSGDVAAIDEDGNYFITGRIKDIVIRGGVNIFPAEVENAYQNHEGIAESCLVGYPDPELGERTCLCVVPKEGADDSAAALRDFAKGRLEKCKIPDVVMKMDELPRLANGKTDKTTLRDVVAAVSKLVNE
jgi:acyl-CoA synthetase (AMP-forming)/AMP-acid ligase II